MRIAMVSERANPSDPLGDQSRHVAELSAGLTRAGHAVTVYTRHDGPGQRTGTAEGGYRVVPIPAGPPRPLETEEVLPHLGSFAAFLDEAWAAETPEVVHAHFWMSGITAVTAAKAMGIPIAQTFHTLAAAGKTDATTAERVRLERLVGRNVARIVAMSTVEAEELARLGVPRARISVVPGGVDLAVFTATGATQRRGRAHRIVSVGELSEDSGFDIAITALRALPGTELVIAGKSGKPDSISPFLHEYAVRQGVGDRVSLLNDLPDADLPALLRSADVVVCTARAQTAHGMPVEAMACGVPVVATGVGDLSDTVVDGVTGTLVPVDRPDHLAEAVKELLLDNALREAYGIAGSERARCRYSWDRVAADTFRAYEHVLPEQARPALQPD
ncbi:glycosyltransferase [Saccharomonospora sp. NPDC006951]